MTIITLLLTAILSLLFIWAALSPLESLGWYAGWFGAEAEGDPNASPTQKEAETPAAVPLPTAPHYLVYLSGIGAITANSIPDEEFPFIAGLEETLPATKVISDVFPYTVTNMGLTGQRVTAGLWRWVEGLRLKNPMAAAALIVNVRNMFQVAISADRRYGPIYNWGVARAIRDKLIAHGYQIGSKTPVTLLGWSGGSQIALGAAWYLPGMIDAPVSVISVGGVMSDDMGIKRIHHLWHMWGQKDPLAPLGGYLYAGRWKVFPNSVWNRLLEEGKITLIPLGPFTHNGKGNYFDNEMTLPNGETHMRFVLSQVKAALSDDGLIPK